MKTVLKTEAVAAKMRELNGNLAAVARSFGVTRQAVHDFVKRHPTLAAAAIECRESMKDDAESSLHRALLAGEAWAVCFYLKCQAKDRGYVERHEHTGVDGEPIQYEDLTPTSRLAALARIAARVGGEGNGPHSDGEGNGNGSTLGASRNGHAKGGDESGPLADDSAPLFG